MTARIFKFIIAILFLGGVLFIGLMIFSGETRSLDLGESGSDVALTADTAQVVTDTAPEENSEDPLIATVPSEYTIQADVKLEGSGTGYHAKLVACTKTSAVSFGIQYDQYGEGAYNDETTFIFENIESNAAGGQEYTRTGYSSLGQTYNLMLAVARDGTCSAYVDGNLVGSVVNPELADKKLYLRVEGSGRINGDSVSATFENIHLKGSGRYNPKKHWGTYNFDTNAGIESDDSTFTSKDAVFINGTVEGIPENADWDSAYEEVSGIIQFVE